VWKIYGGCDFDAEKFTRNASGSQLNCSPKISTSDGKAGRRRGWGASRNADCLMEIHLNKIQFLHEVFPENAVQICRDVLTVQDIEIKDRLSTSQINKFLYQYSSEDRPKQSSSNMVSIKFLVSKPEDTARSKEASLRISIQPIRMNIDQDSLMFLKMYFEDMLDQASPSKSYDTTNISSSPSEEPFQSVLNKNTPQMSASPRVDSEPIINIDEMSLENTDDTEKLFFRSFILSPDVPIRLDYHGKHVSMEQGTLAGLLIGLGQLNCSELYLKRLNCRSGVLGGEKLVTYMLNEWLQDIRKNQLQSILGGVGPAYSFVQLFQGIKDLFWMPIAQYRQDGRIMRGLQKGAHSFSASTAMAFLELSNRLVSTIQSIAEVTLEMVSPIGQLGSGDTSRTEANPADLRIGVANAYNLLSEGLQKTASNMVRVATEEHERKGKVGALTGVIRQLPPTIVQPLILATEATSNVLGGARNQLAPDRHREAVEKWKQDQE